jgi:hypothetical protein
MIKANLRDFMFFSHETLVSLLASRHKLYVQLGLIDRHVAAARAGPASSRPPRSAASMRELTEEVERQIAEINRRIARFKGPILDEAVLAADPG